jgi:hypothetical protein
MLKDQSPIPLSLTHGAEDAGINYASHWSARVWYGFTDRRFTRWGKYSKVLVPRLTRKIALPLGVAYDSLANMAKNGPMVTDYLQSGGWDDSAEPCRK